MYLIPTWDLEIEQKSAFRKFAIENLISRGVCKWAINQSEIITRQLLAQDLGLSSWQTPPQEAGEEKPWVSHVIPSNNIIIITGIVQLSQCPKVSTIAFKVGHASNLRAIFDIDEIYSGLPIAKRFKIYEERGELYCKFGKLKDVKMSAFLSHPILYDNSTLINITVKSPEENKNGDKLMLNGFIAEPRQTTII